MEYKIFYYIRNNTIIPFVLRYFLSVILILFSIIPILLPIFPGSFVFWIFILVTGFILIIPSNKLRYLIKLRKSLIYLFANLHKKHIIKHKIYDIKSQVKKILNDKRIRREEQIIKKHQKKLEIYKNISKKNLYKKQFDN